jgi:beta-glucosidase
VHQAVEATRQGGGERGIELSVDGRRRCRVPRSQAAGGVCRWLELAREDDFLGIQNYESRWYDSSGEVPPAPGTPVNGMGSAIDPTSLAGAVRYAHAESGVPILVTEHGMQTPHDKQRADFIEPSLAGLLDAMGDGVPVLGYLHWTLMDNFEWIFGYGAQLGLHEVDRETFVRTPKRSAEVYAGIARARCVRACRDGQAWPRP